MPPNPKINVFKGVKVKCKVNPCMSHVLVTDDNQGLCRPHLAEIKKHGFIKKKETGKSASYLKMKSTGERRIALDKALAAFQKYRKVFEADDNGYVEVVGGGKMKWNDPKCHGGHFHSSSILATAFDWRNVWPQRAGDNHAMFLGDEKAKQKYCDWLVKKIGKDEKDVIDKLARTSEHLTIYELNEKTKKYNHLIVKISKHKKLLKSESKSRNQKSRSEHKQTKKSTSNVEEPFIANEQKSSQSIGRK